MKKLLAFIITIVAITTLTACGNNDENENTLAEMPEVINMENLDDYMGRPDTQYTDLRNFDDKMSGGWIRGFDIIPFFDYLENNDILVREDGWNFDASNIKNEDALRGLFDEDKNILIMCAGGTRAGYVKAALEHLGYDNVWNIGGLGDYEGDNKIYGDGEYEITVVPTLPEEIKMDTLDTYMYRSDTQYTDLRNFDDQMSGGWIRGFEMIPFFDYLEYEDILVRGDGWTFSESDIKDENALRALFDEDKNIFLMCAGGTRAGYVKAALEHLGYENVYNLGGLGDYEGDNKVYGDGEYEITMPAKN